MRRGRSIALLLAGLFAPSTGRLAEEAHMVELATPHRIEQGEAVRLQVTTGPLPRGARLTIATERGETLGVVAPFGQEFARGSTTATIPVPRSAIADGHVRLQLQVLEPGQAPRPPRPDEVGHLGLVLVPGVE